MKINATPPLNIPDQRRNEEMQPHERSDFRQIFDDMLDRPPPGEALPATLAPSAVPARMGVLPVEKSPDGSGLQMMEGFLDALEAYQQRLGDPRNSLRDVAPTLDRLSAAHDRLSHFADNASGDDALQSIIAEGLVTAMMEISRFRSGLYC
jgi:hypothetical protein